MATIRQQQQIEVLVRLDQRVDDEQCVVRRHIGVQRAVREQQLALQVPCHELVRLVVVVGRAVRVRLQQPLPLLAPVVFVAAIVVIAGFGDTDLEEIGVAEHRARGRVAAA